jgi:hypothetical protein
MNAGRAIRHLEDAGFSPQQAIAVIEVMQDAVRSKVAIKDSVGLSYERPPPRSRLDAADRLVRAWITVIAMVQTVVTIFGTVGLIEILK